MYITGNLPNIPFVFTLGVVHGHFLERIVEVKFTGREAVCWFNIF